LFFIDFHHCFIFINNYIILFLFIIFRIIVKITTYKIDKETGFLKVINYTDVLGKTPRFMTFKKDTNKLFCANEESDTIVEFELDDNGFLKHTGKIINSKSPVCIIFR